MINLLRLRLTGDIYNDFKRHLRTDRTRKLYETALIDFMNYLKISKIEDLLTLKNTQKTIISYLDHLTDQGFSYSYRNIAKSALAYFYMRQDFITLNWKKIAQSLGEPRQPRQDRPYTIEEIQKILHVASPQAKALITLLVSSGIRIGAIPDLKKKDYKHVENLAQLTVYRGTKWQYVTYVTPEARHYIDTYLKERESDGEQLTDESPLFRQVYDRTNANKNVKQLDYSGVKSVLQRIRQRAGLTDKTGKVKRGGTHKYDTSASNSFRKFNYNALSEAGVRTDILEKLAGRGKATIADRHYHRPVETELLSNYRKAINNLTIDNSFRLQEKIDTIEKKQEYEIQSLRSQINAMEQNMNQIMREVNKNFDEDKHTMLLDTTDFTEEQIEKIKKTGGDVRK